MPTYSYLCTECESTFDVFHSMKCTDLQLCPKCGEPGKKLLSPSSIIFKGSGFYSTDYRDSGYLEAKKRDSAPPGNNDSSSAAGKKDGATSPAAAKSAADTSAAASSSTSSTSSSADAGAPGRSPASTPGSSATA